MDFCNKDNINLTLDALLSDRKSFIQDLCNTDNLIKQQIMFIELLKVTNYYFYLLMFGSDEIKKVLIADKELYLSGVNIFSDYLFCDFTKTMYVPTFVTDQIRKIVEFISLCGEIGEIERIRDYCKYNLIEYTGQSDNRLQFQFVNRYNSLENFEILEGMANAVRILNKQTSQMDTLEQKKHFTQ